MKRLLCTVSAFIAGVALIVSPAISQPPGGGKEGKGGKGGFKLGMVFPPPLVEELNLTADQRAKLQVIEKDLKVKLDKLLTTEQKKTVAEFRPMGPGGPGGPGGPDGPGGPEGKGGKGMNKGDKGGKGFPPGEKNGPPGDRS